MRIAQEEIFGLEYGVEGIGEYVELQQITSPAA
jgi:hypothetical protein